MICDSMKGPVNEKCIPPVLRTLSRLYALALCHLYSSFFLQQAVTQPKALVDTMTVNMTWKAPMYGFQNVAFWYGTMHGCASFSYSISCTLHALDMCCRGVAQDSHGFGCAQFTVSNGIRFSNSFVAVHPSSMSCK